VREAAAWAHVTFFCFGCSSKYYIRASGNDRCSSTRIFWIAFSCRNVGQSGDLDMWDPEQFLYRIGPEQLVSRWSFIPHIGQMMSEVHLSVCVQTFGI
jgi:hypothetical protein